MARIARLRRASRDLGRGGSAPLTAILERQLEETIAACKLARAVAEGSAVPRDAHEQMAEIEHGGDVLRGELVTRLARVLVSPIDRLVQRSTSPPSLPSRRASRSSRPQPQPPDLRETLSRHRYTPLQCTISFFTCSDSTFRGLSG